MISRQWRGLAKPAFAEAYVQHLETETFPAIHKLPGFVSASILRRSVPNGVEFLIVTQWHQSTQSKHSLALKSKLQLFLKGARNDD